MQLPVVIEVKNGRCARLAQTMPFTSRSINLDTHLTSLTEIHAATRRIGNDS
jgi:hypothetical protein